MARALKIAWERSEEAEASSSCALSSAAASAASARPLKCASPDWPYEWYEARHPGSLRK